MSQEIQFSAKKNKNFKISRKYDIQTDGELKSFHKACRLKDVLLWLGQHENTQYSAIDKALRSGL